MTIAVLYWILMLFLSWRDLRDAAGGLILFILLLIIGWRLFGSPVHG